MNRPHLHRGSLLALVAAVIAVSLAGTVLLAGCNSAGAERTEAPLKVLIVYDLEGVTGATTGRSVNFGGEGYAEVRQSLTEDVNAAIRGLLAAGATEIVITDGHGSGNPDPDYLLEKLPAGARFDIRDKPYDAYIDTIDDTFAAVVAIGMHSGAEGAGFLSHTYSGHLKWAIGGEAINESMIVAASAARFGVPLVMVTGDQVLQQEVAAFSPQTAYAVVKSSSARDKTEPHPREVVSSEIEAAAKRGFGNRAAIKPWTPRSSGGTFENLFSYRLPEMASVAINFPHAEAVDNKTVRIKTSSFLDAYLTFRALGTFTSLAQSRLVLDLVRTVEGGPEMIREAQSRGARPGQTGFEATAPELERIWSSMGRHGYK
jgi:D-amino peptidase